MAQGALPVRIRLPCSASATSRMWCRTSMADCPRSQSASCAGLASLAVGLVIA